jgi:hypothetical protein
MITARFLIPLLTAAFLSGLHAEDNEKPSTNEPMMATPTVSCAGEYPKHLQGVCMDDAGNLYWSWTTSIVKTDATGTILAQVDAPNHQGDLCYVDGSIYVAVNLGKFNKPAGQADSWVYQFDAGSLKLVKQYPVQEAVHGAGGMEFVDGHFFVVGGLPEDYDRNFVFEYDRDFKFVRKHEILSGWTQLGIQTAFFKDGCWWFGCYGKPAVLLKVSRDFKDVGVYHFNASVGITSDSAGPREFLVAVDKANKDKKHSAKLHKVTLNDTSLAKIKLR